MEDAGDLEKLKLEDLKTILKKKGIVCTDKKKAELVTLVRKANSLYPDLEEDDHDASERFVILIANFRGRFVSKQPTLNSFLISQYCSPSGRGNSPSLFAVCCCRILTSAAVDIA